MVYEEKRLSELKDKIRELDYLVKVNAFFLIHRKWEHFIITKKSIIHITEYESNIHFTGIEGEYCTKSITSIF